MIRWMKTSKQSYYFYRIQDYCKTEDILGFKIWREILSHPHNYIISKATDSGILSSCADFLVDTSAHLHSLFCSKCFKTNMVWICLVLYQNSGIIVLNYLFFGLGLGIPSQLSSQSMDTVHGMLSVRFLYFYCLYRACFSSQLPLHLGRCSQCRVGVDGGLRQITHARINNAVCMLLHHTPSLGLFV